MTHCMKGLTLLLALGLAGCDTSDFSPEAVYEVEIAPIGGDPERFLLGVATAEQIALADAALASRREGVIHGIVVRGDGGFNTSYSWHLGPESVTFPDLAMEVCDGRPRSDVESDIDYWVETIGVYCPWGARVVRRVR